jgi:hypothetical protein
MTNTTNSQDLSKRIEQLVAEYISATRVAAEAAVERAFATAMAPSARQRSAITATTTAPAPARSRTGARRAAGEIEAVCERLYEAVCKTPGETMMVIAPAIGATARELNRPMLRLKKTGRIRSVGTRQATRYFPMARDA